MSNRQTAVELAQQRESNELYARQSAINVAHDRDQTPEEVVRRADAYYRFIMGEKSA